jgi:hypothetical protein
MASKITDYPAKTTFNDGDLYDVSTFDGVTTYTSEKMTFTQLKAELNSALSFSSIYSADGSLTAARTVTLTSVNTLTFDGGLTTFKGQDTTSSNYAAKFQDSTGTDIMVVRNDGRVGINGTADPNTTLSVTSTTLFNNGFTCNSNGGVAATGNGSNGGTGIRGYSTTGIGVQGVSDGTNAGVIGTSVNGTGGQFSGNQALYASGVTLLRGIDATSSNYAVKFQDVSGTDLMTVRNDGIINISSLPTSSAGLSAGDLWNNSNVINIV